LNLNRKRLIILLATLALLVLAALPLGLMLVGPLEDRFVANPALPDRVDGIVVLGGAADEALSLARGQLVLGDAAERLLAFVALARRYPAADLIVSRGANGEGLDSDARTAWPAGFFADFGIDPARIRYDGRARNTAENAVFGRKLADPEPGENWVLVTSAWHMPRAMGVFRAAGWPMIPYPVDYRTDGTPGLQLGINLRRAMSLLALGLREWAALGFYRLLGHTEELLPGR
jgi:uncharacterized SAM-binding protein YcdF (DUF218 family)|tara:strand:+ start:1337 stop:2032 length:696 start_codon:yes stop_codon:yes gene_type:complete